MATSDSRLPLFDHTHDIGTTAITGIASVLLGWYAAWLFAGMLPRLLVFPLAVVLVGVSVYRQPDARGVVASLFYALGTLVILTPVAIELPVLLAADMPGVTSPWARILTMTNLKLFAGFALVGAILGAIGYSIKHTEAIKSRLSNLR
jgi:sulfite exporter TauE/SafE